MRGLPSGPLRDALSKRLHSSLNTVTTNSSPQISTGILLKRAPIVTRPLSHLESSYLEFKWTQQLETAKPFHPDFYFKKGSMAEQVFKSHQSSDPSAPVQQVLEPFEAEPRETEADKTGNERTPLRKLERTLYLLVQSPKSTQWTFLTQPMIPGEFLHESADRLIPECLGPQVDFWRVGKVPVGHFMDESSTVFFMKCHWMPGSKLELKPNAGKDFAWVTKEELRAKVDPTYYERIKDMLSDF